MDELPFWRKSFVQVRLSSTRPRKGPMRSPILLALCVFGAITACGTGDREHTPDASPDATRDAAIRPDAADGSHHNDAGEEDASGRDAHENRDGSTDTEADAGADPTAPRLLAPLSTSRVTSQTPTLRWTLPSGVTDATVDLCLDRACAKPLGKPARVKGSSYTPSTQLPAGVVYWRVHPSTVATVTSPTWQFTVGARSAPLDVSSGTTLDVNGDGYADLVVGASGSTGGVDVYLGGLSGLATVPDTQNDPGNTVGDAFGASVASAGDVDGDGYADLVVGAPGASGSAGSAYVYLGGASGLARIPLPLEDPGGMAGDAFGASVASAGDVNGDGYADLVVGAPGASGSAGRAYVYLGGPAGLASVPVTLNDPADTPGDAFGASVTSAGDVNGDGYVDVAVGAPGASSSAGGAYVYLGGPSGLGAVPISLSDPGTTAGDSFGLPVATAGDMNGDGYADLVVGASGASSSTGSVYVYFGGPSGLVTLPTTLNDPHTTAGDLFGLSVASAGDVNGDGYVDLAVAAQGVSSASGDVYLFLGGPPSPLGPLVATLSDPGQGPGDTFGASVASAGDLNGDGYADLVAGAPGVASSAGSAYVYLGGSPALGAAIPLASPAGAGGRFGGSVFGASN